MSAAKIFAAAVGSRLTAVAVGAARASGASAIAFAAATSRPAAPALAAVTGPSVGDGGVSAFYVWQDALPATPGSMLREEPLSPTQSQRGRCRELADPLHLDCGCWWA